MQMLRTIFGRPRNVKWAPGRAPFDCWENAGLGTVTPRQDDGRGLNLFAIEEGCPFSSAALKFPNPNRGPAGE